MIHVLGPIATMLIGSKPCWSPAVLHVMIQNYHV